MINNAPTQLRSALLAAAALTAAACPAGTSTPAHSPEATAVENAPQAEAQTEAQAETAPPEPALSIEEQGRAILHTTEGPITVTFFPGVAPRTVEHITDLMSAGCYQGVELFRLEPGFVLQVAPVADEGCHPEAMSTVPGEFSKVPHQRFYLSMARWEDVNSGTSSWSIMLGPAPSMDGQFTVFGRVVDGQDTIAKIEAIGSTKADDGMSRLDKPVSIERVEIDMSTQD